MLLIAYGLSNNKRKIPWRVIICGTLLQIVFALLVLKTVPGRAVFETAGDAIRRTLDFTNEGSKFVFGSLVTNTESFGFIFAFRVLPTIIFFSSLMAVLYYFGIMQVVVVAMAKGMTKLMGVSGAESLSVAANIFVGQTEAPLVVRPYVASMTTSELMVLMTGGMATIAGGVMAAYVGMGIDPAHLLSASIMSAPAALVIAKIMIPETAVPMTAGRVKIDVPKTDANVIDAAARGASDGLRLALNVGAMLLAFIALISLINYLLGLFGTNFETLLGYLCSPMAFVMGVPWEESFKVGNLLGQRIVINEFYAYANMAQMLKELSPRSSVILTYALCGFANFSSIAIQLGGIGGIAPERRQDLARLGIRAMIGGLLASYMTATIAGILI